MDTKALLPGSSHPPIEPRLGNMGRSIADRWAIHTMIKVLHEAGELEHAAGLVGELSSGIKENVEAALETEMGDQFVSQLNTPKLRQDCKMRLRFLLNEMKPT